MNIAARAEHLERSAQLAAAALGSKVEEKSPYKGRLPRVSIIVVNYNYGRFLHDALGSIAAQTYPNIETIVVDDQSTDDSWSIIKRLTSPAGCLPDARALRPARNCGHGGCAALGLAQSSGSYIVFLDADDTLLPRCVEAHVYAHLSSRVPIGFSSVDVYCRFEEQWVTSTLGHERSSYLARYAGAPKDMFRPIHVAAPTDWADARLSSLHLDEMHVVPAPFCDWVWGPMSANCFRRDIVCHFLEASDAFAVRNGLDIYLMQPIASLCGSLLIDRPLIEYRIHQTNNFIRYAPLARMLIYDTNVNANPATKNAVRRTFEFVEARGNVFAEHEFFYEAVSSQCRTWLGWQEGEAKAMGFLIECLIDFQDVLVREFGEPVLNAWLKRSGAQPRKKNGRLSVELKGTVLSRAGVM